MNRFQSVATLGGSAMPEDWRERAVDVLAPVRSEGGSVEVVTTPGISAIRLGFGEDQVEIRAVNGVPTGLIPPSQSAGLFLVCLVALRKEIGSIELFDDQDDPKRVPTRVHAAQPAYAADWERVSNLAEKLGLMQGEKFFAAHRPNFARFF